MHVNEPLVDNGSCGGIYARGSDILITNPELYKYYRKNMRVVDINNSNTSRV